MPEPTEGERKNGWDEDSLNRYLAERKKAQDVVISFDPQAREPRKPHRANSRYNPHRWRS